MTGAGTGGTLSGVALYLKQEKQMGDSLKIILADPEGSGLYNKVGANLCGSSLLSV